MKKAYLLGNAPDGLDFDYVSQPPFEAVVIGSLSLGQLLHFSDETVLSALSRGMPVYLYTPGLPQAPGNRPLAASLSSAQRELKNWGVLFTDGSRRRIVTAEEARLLRRSHQMPAPGAVLTPLAKEILEGLD